MTDNKVQLYTQQDINAIRNFGNRNQKPLPVDKEAESLKLAQIQENMNEPVRAIMDITKSKLSESPKKWLFLNWLAKKKQETATEFKLRTTAVSDIVKKERRNFDGMFTTLSGTVKALEASADINRQRAADLREDIEAITKIEEDAKSKSFDDPQQKSDHEDYLYEITTRKTSLVKRLQVAETNFGSAKVLCRLSRNLEIKMEDTRTNTFDLILDSLNQDAMTRNISNIADTVNKLEDVAAEIVGSANTNVADTIVSISNTGNNRMDNNFMEAQRNKIFAAIDQAKSNYEKSLEAMRIDNEKAMETLKIGTDSETVI